MIFGIDERGERKGMIQNMKEREDGDFFRKVIDSKLGKATGVS